MSIDATNFGLSRLDTVAKTRVGTGDEEQIKTRNVIIVAGKFNCRSRELNPAVNQIYTLDQVDMEFTAQVAIKFEKGKHSNVNNRPEFLQTLADIVGEDNFDLKTVRTKRPSVQSIGH